jgi:prevent-host-death family protein
MERFASVYEFKSELSKFLDLVASGDEVVVTKNGKPVARLVAEMKPKLKLGALAEEMSDWVDFDLNSIDWVEEIPQWSELYSKDEK